ncbi:SAM-dependent methyltransferase [Hydrogenivirga sp.]
MAPSSAKHLDIKSLVNLGSFYTSTEYVDIVWDFIEPYIGKGTVVFDPACGYGAFLRKRTDARKIGNDIDTEALRVASSQIEDAEFFNHNALKTFDREAYGIKKGDRLIVIGNPPYNDTTSQAKKRLKRLSFDIDPRLKARDIGISFLRMFYYLRADYVCVLHPLSFLIKRANLNLLREFRFHYRLINGLVISSRVFSGTSKSSEFPIIIALYKRDIKGMDYTYIENYPFHTIEGKSFRLSDFDYIGRYIRKYPSKRESPKEGDLLFYTMRDINALKRNATFIDRPTAGAVRVDIDKLDYYVYVDVFKDFAHRLPYYLGNLDIPINRELFEEYREYFISYALKKHEFLRKFYNEPIREEDYLKLLEYFRKLLGEHFYENT